MGLIWGTLISILGLVGAILITVAARLISDDVKEWLPWITCHLIERAVNRLPEEQRERFEQEWWAHINELPGNLAKVYTAWGCLSASKGINRIAMFGDTATYKERAATGILFVLCFPLILVIAISVKLESRGPVFFKQKRLGANNLSFDLLKFRSMYVEQADPLGQHLAQIGNHPRITRVGRLLRTTNMDELPQLINVLRGDMSLVGLRPLAAIWRVDSGALPEEPQSPEGSKASPSDIAIGLFFFALATLIWAMILSGIWAMILAIASKGTVALTALTTHFLG